jgi:hypothetical protein
MRGVQGVDHVDLIDLVLFPLRKRGNVVQKILGARASPEKGTLVGLVLDKGDILAYIQSVLVENFIGLIGWI